MPKFFCGLGVYQVLSPHYSFQKSPNSRQERESWVGVSHFGCELGVAKNLVGTFGISNNLTYELISTYDKNPDS